MQLFLTSPSVAGRVNMSGQPSQAFKVALSVVLLLLSFAARIASAVQASPFPFTVNQPDGTLACY
jgi:hypothetical protein